jgi:hypothetical protein
MSWAMIFSHSVAGPRVQISLVLRDMSGMKAGDVPLCQYERIGTGLKKHGLPCYGKPWLHSDHGVFSLPGAIMIQSPSQAPQNESARPGVAKNPF